MDIPLTSLREVYYFHADSADYLESTQIHFQATCKDFLSNIQDGAYVQIYFENVIQSDDDRVPSTVSKERPLKLITRNIVFLELHV